MQVPLQVAFEHIEPSDFIEKRVREEVEKLEQFYDRITSARVVITRPQHRHHTGDLYAVRLHLTLPGAPDISVSREPAMEGRHEDMQATIADAFGAARRQLQDLVRLRQPGPGSDVQHYCARRTNSSPETCRTRSSSRGTT